MPRRALWKLAECEEHGWFYFYLIVPERFKYYFGPCEKFDNLLSIVLVWTRDGAPVGSPAARAYSGGRGLSCSSSSINAGTERCRHLQRFTLDALHTQWAKDDSASARIHVDRC